MGMTHEQLDVLNRIESNLNIGYDGPNNMYLVRTWIERHIGASRRVEEERTRIRCHANSCTCCSGRRRCQ